TGPEASRSGARDPLLWFFLRGVIPFGYIWRGMWRESHGTSPTRWNRHAPTPGLAGGVRPLSHPQETRRWRHGRRLPGRGYAAAPQGGPQGAALYDWHADTSPGALPARGPPGRRH